MKDKKGVDRGRCKQPDCDCDEYACPADGFKCEYCGHYPVDHANLSVQGGPPTPAKPQPQPQPQPQQPAVVGAAAASAPEPLSEKGTAQNILRRSAQLAMASGAASAEKQCPMCGCFVSQDSFAAHAATCAKPAQSPPATAPAPAPAPAPALVVAAAAAVDPRVAAIAGSLPEGFPAARIAEVLRSNAGDVDAALAVLLGEAEHRGSAGAGAGAGGARPTEWPADAVETLAASLPASFAREKIVELMREYTPKGDMDGLLALLFAAADAASAPRAADPDPETLRLMMEAATPERDCILCLETYPVTQMYTVNCPSAHRFCFECINRYLEMCIKDNLPATCPAPKNSCQHVMAEDELQQVVSGCPPGTASTLTREKIAKYSEQMLMRCVKSIPGIIGCPTPGCANYVIPADTTRKERCTCQACRASFCSLCKKLYHFHCNCDQVAQYTERWTEWCLSGRARYNRDKADALQRIASQRDAIEKRNAELRTKYESMMADEQYKASNGRHCPHCHRVIIKDGGCDSMVCGRDYHGGNVQDGCGHHFSWSSAAPYRSAALSRPHEEPMAVDIPEVAREVVHVGIACDRCKKEIKGLRFSCVHCAAFDLCEHCEVDGTLSHPRDHVWHICTSADS